jgi:hypothetical protein
MIAAPLGPPQIQPRQIDEPVAEVCKARRGRRYSRRLRTRIADACILNADRDRIVSTCRRMPEDARQVAVTR